jgi:phytanoyl-CoA hydroxylase
MTESGLTQDCLDHYREHGFTVARGVFSHEECDGFVQRMVDWISGEQPIEGMSVRKPDQWDRTLNQHLVDPVCKEWLLHPRLRPLLADCMQDDPEGVQTMYFFKGSTQGRHQDQYYLPGCMSTWIALMDVGQHNGTIWVQKGSHQKHLVTARELKHSSGQDFSNGEEYHVALERVFEENTAEHGLEEVPVEVAKGDVVLFHGVLIHRGGPVGESGSFRHVLANHYVPQGFEGWPYGEWPRFGFDGDVSADTSERTEGWQGHPNRVTKPEAIDNQVAVY